MNHVVTFELDVLADRCEQSGGPDRELDIMIAYAINLRLEDAAISFRETFDICGMDEMIVITRNHHNLWHDALPRYTASMDAAATLVPDNFKWKLGYSKHVPHVAEVVDYVGGAGSFVSECDYTRALALCAAALRSRNKF